MKPMSGSRVLFALLAAAFAPGVAAAQEWTNKLTTPIRIQDGYGSAGNGLPYNGLSYCVPTAATMSLQYLAANGYTQLGPAVPTAADSLNLNRIIGGLMSTSAYTGTTRADQYFGFRDYLAAKGISTANYSYGYNPLNSAAAVSALAAVNVNQTVVNLTFGLYSTGSSPTRIAGHVVALAGQGVNASGQASANTIAINNPQPSAFLPSADTAAAGRQYLNLVPTSGALAAFGGTSLDPAQATGFWAHGQTVLEGYNYLTIDASQRTANNPTAATWTLTASKALNTNGGDLEVLAPLDGAGGVAKSGAGTLTLTAAVTTTGAFSVSGGTLASTVAGGRAFGSGSLTVSAGSLSVAPAGAGGAVALTSADGAGATFTYGTVEQMVLDRGSRPSLKFTVGGNTNGTTANVARATRGTLVLVPAGGTAGLGSTESFVVYGTAANLPAVTNGIVSPSIVVRDAGAAGAGDFLTYGAAGFVKAAYTLGSAVPVNSSTAASVYEANTAQTLAAGSTASVYALKVGAVTVGGAGGTTTLQVGPQTAGGQAGLILNGGTVATTALAFGAAEAVVYAGPSGGTIAAAVQGSGTFLKFGSGALTITAASSYTGATYIQQGTLVAANPSGSATGTGAVVVGPAGTFQVNTATGSTAGTTAQSGGTVRLNGGTLTGPLVMSSGSTLTGTGTVAGTTTLGGGVSGLTNLTFSGPVTSTSSFTYSWRLNAFDATAAGAGTSYSQLRFANGSQTVLGNGGSTTGFYMNLDLADGLPDPNGADPFWTQPHTWAVMKTTSGSFNTLWFNYAFPSFADGSFGVGFDGAFTTMSVNYTPSAVPEPARLLAFGLVGLALARRALRRGKVLGFVGVPASAGY